MLRLPCYNRELPFEVDHLELWDEHYFTGTIVIGYDDADTYDVDRAEGILSVENHENEEYTYDSYKAASRILLSVIKDAFYRHVKEKTVFDDVADMIQNEIDNHS